MYKRYPISRLPEKASMMTNAVDVMNHVTMDKGVERKWSIHNNSRNPGTIGLKYRHNKPNYSRRAEYETTVQDEFKMLTTGQKVERVRCSFLDNFMDSDWWSGMSQSL